MDKIKQNIAKQIFDQLTKDQKKELVEFMLNNKETLKMIKSKFLQINKVDKFKNGGGGHD